ncbi:hypothetical protein ACJIZ3_023060 [Penstemon smallii]|uniref:DUF4218 domain-containing protein n=1 Tax=Penstemon smallii TaxID=265156 RepID=A0ABD3TN37_9LAMI
MLLEVLRKALPSGKTLPQSYYEAKKIIKNLGLHYKKIHACVNDCILYRKEYEKEEQCPKCFSPRYKFNEVYSSTIGRKKGSKIPQKILRYFPLKPRLQRLFISKKTALDMRWHKERRVDDGILRHPADAEEWKEFDKLHESFAEDPRNVRLGLATDGFNPFSNMSTSYSTWPVILLPYNLPPWKCMKSPFFILSMLISGPKSPGNDIDVFLEPLIEELHDLWSYGVETYDASDGTSFFLRAAILWTINDFPAYGIISGWCTKGYMACPICNKETCSFWLKNGKKVCYQGHRRFLPLDHKWRDLKSAFDGKKEYRDKPMPMSGDDVVAQLSCIQPVTFGKTQPKKRKRDEDLNWKKNSIFFKLPYWRTLKLRHNLDVMHIEKNVCDNILDTLLDIDGKTKDNIKARFDLQALGIRKHAKLDGNSYLVPPACHTLSMVEKRKLCAFLASVKFPDGYASNLSKCVNSKECRLTGMKTHDCHVILQKLLPLSIRGSLSDNVCDAINELSDFFTRLCSKELKPEELENLESKISLTLCKLERIFPPAFFDIMVHLPIHLAREATLGGPVQYRWMYPIERYLCKLKRYVNNKAFPEGSIAEGYIAEECLTFCSMYLDDIETQFNKIERNYDNCKEKSQQNLSVFSDNTRLIGKGVYNFIDKKSWEQAHSYVLKNTDEVLPFICEEKKKAHTNLEYIAYHPDQRVTHYEACVVNGLRFHTKQREINKKTQNCGVVVKVEEESGYRDYYGVLIDIIQLDYLGNNHVVLFKCDWYEGRSIQKDKYNSTSINMSKPWKTKEPYVLASQAQQVFYVNDIKLGNDWKVVIKAEARSSWNVLENDDGNSTIINEPIQQNEPDSTSIPSTISYDFEEWQRTDIPAATIDSDGLAPVEEDLDEFIEDEDEDDETLAEYNEEDEEQIDNEDDTEMDESEGEHD